MRLAKITIDTFEESMRYPVVSHTFTGKTLEEAQSYVEIHKKTDTFFGGCAEGQFKTMKCRNVPRPERANGAFKWFLIGLAGYVGYRLVQ